MLEEANAQPGAFGGTFDQAGNVGDHEALVATDADHAEVRHQGGERIVGHLRLGRGHCADESALAGIRQSQQADVGQHLQFQLEVTRLARLARGGLARRPIGTGFETGVTEAVPAALSDHQPLTGLGQVADDFLGIGVDHGGTDRHRQDQVVALGPGAVLAAAVLAALGIETAGVAIVDQGVQVDVGFQIDGTAVATVAAVGTALFDELLATKAHEAIAAVTGFHVD